MKTAAGALLLLALLAAAPPARADGAAGGEATTADVIEDVTAGYDGAFAPPPHVSPVWVTLRHPGPGPALTLEVVALGEEATPATVQVELPPGGRRQVCLAVAAARDLLVEVRGAAGQRLSQRTVPGRGVLDLESHVLSVDGRPADERRGEGSRRDDPSLRVSAILPEHAPTEAACYAAFGAVVVRGVDPGAWGALRLAALLEYVAQGGKVLVPSATPRHPEARALLTRLPGVARDDKLLGRPVRLHRLGLGEVFAFADDPLLHAAGSDAKAAQTRQDLADLANTEPAASIARLHERWEGSPGEHPGTRTRLLVAGYALAYLIVLGPVLGLALRRSSRRRLAAAVGGAIALFTVLAPLVAAAVRSGDAQVVVREAVRLLPQGDALAMGQVTCVSGGGASYRLRLSAHPERLGAGVRALLEPAATVLPPGTPTRQEWGGRAWRRLPPQPPTLRTSRGATVELELAMSPWGQQGAATLASLQGLAPLQAELLPRGRDYEVRVVNTTGVPLERAILLEAGAELHDRTPFVSLGPLPPGASTVVSPPPSAEAAQAAPLPPPTGAKRPTWASTLDVPARWTAWQHAWRGSEPEGPLRYVIVSRAPGLLSLSGDEVDVVHHALRIDPVATPAAVIRGYLGVVLEEGRRWGGREPAAVETVLGRVVPDSPAAQAGLEAGLLVTSVDGVPPMSPRHMRELLAKRVPGERVSLRVRDRQPGRERAVTVRLAVRGPEQEGD